MSEIGPIFFGVFRVLIIPAGFGYTNGLDFAQRGKASRRDRVERFGPPMVFGIRQSLC
jgi:hypothetical protein